MATSAFRVRQRQLATVVNPLTPLRQVDKMVQMRAERTGSMLMIGAAGCFTINDALCKWLMPEFTVGQIISMRSLAVLALVASAAMVSRPVSRQLVFGNYKLHTLRAG